MDKGKGHAPFGLLFEEPASQPPSLIVPTYDEGTDLSYVEDSDGHRIPYVECNGIGNVGTETVTLVEAERTDTDPEDDKGYSTIVQQPLAATDTFTKEDRESTDTD